MASVFIVRDGRVCSYAHFDALAATLQHAEVSEAEEVRSNELS